MSWARVLVLVFNCSATFCLPWLLFLIRFQSRHIILQLFGCKEGWLILLMSPPTSPSTYELEYNQLHKVWLFRKTRQVAQSLYKAHSYPHHSPFFHHYIVTTFPYSLVQKIDTGEWRRKARMLQLSYAFHTPKCPNNQFGRELSESWEIPTIQDWALPFPILGKFPSPCQAQEGWGPGDKETAKLKLNEIRGLLAF